MKIIGLRIAGIRRIEAIQMAIAPQGLTQIRGRNQQGKSTVLDSLELLFKGFRHRTDDMIRHGSKRLEIEGELVDNKQPDQPHRFKVKRTDTGVTPRLEIKDERGFSMANKPQEWLDGLVNDLTFNPRPFLEISGEDKLRFVTDFIGADFSDITAKINEAKKERLVLGRQVKDMGVVTEPTPPSRGRIDVSSVQAEINAVHAEARVEQEQYVSEVQKAQAHNEQVLRQEQDRSRRIESATERISRGNNRIKDLLASIEAEKQDIARAEAEVLEQKNLAVAARVEIPTPPPAPVTAELESKILEAQGIDTEWNQYDRERERYQQRVDLTEKYDAATKKIDDLRKQKEERALALALPVPGLSIGPIPGTGEKDDDGNEVDQKFGLMYDGIYSENWSTSLGLMISAQLCIAKNPTLRAVFLDNGESMDAGTLENFHNWCVDNDIQAIVTIVDDIPLEMEPGVFYIEDGKIMTVTDDKEGVANEE